MRAGAFVIVAVLAVAPGEALADSDSLLTAGAGTGFGVITHAGSGATVTGEARLRLRMLVGLGLELSFVQTVPGSPAAAVDQAVRVSGLLYLVPTSPVGGYLKVGIAAPSLGRVREGVGGDITYHAGAGIEVYLHDHLVIGAEVLALVPSLGEVAKDSTSTGTDGSRRVVRVSPSSIAIDSYRAVCTLMYYL